jgi:hypothetical protein
VSNSAVFWLAPSIIIVGLLAYKKYPPKSGRIKKSERRDKDTVKNEKTFHNGSICPRCGMASIHVYEKVFFELMAAQLHGNMAVWGNQDSQEMTHNTYKVFCIRLECGFSKDIHKV